ncbi:hypothetical protein SDC9_64920 [bioreactor metagenome]|uniref:Uncharacterized protein n=1 Tax=bioreactor metagenome TaxID=1076179 RepID=A0A644XRX6_9ZZZZ
MVGVHEQDAPEALAVLLSGVVDRGTLLGHTGVYAEEAELAYKRVCGDFKGQSRKRLVIRRMPFHFSARFGVNSLYGRNVERRGHVVDDGIEQLLYTLVPVGGAAYDRDHFVGDGGGTDGGLNLSGRNLLFHEILLEQRVVDLGDGFQDGMTILGSFVPQIGRNFFYADVHT